MEFSRRHWLTSLGLAPLVACRPRRERQARPSIPMPRLDEFQPRSTLVVPTTRVERPRFPVVDVHTHLTWSNDRTEELQIPMPPEEVLQVMNRKGIRMMINLTGGHGKALEKAIATFQKPYPDRFLVFTEPTYHWIVEPDYPKRQADAIERAHKAGARGLKILKYLGLGLRERVDSGPLVKVDDKRFDLMWEAAGALGMPVAIHTSDPVAFFQPIDRFNERIEELAMHPDWSFHGRDFPSDDELQQARLRVIARHPKTTFILLHVAKAEDLGFVSRILETYPNTYVEFGARINELGRQPRTARKFFERFQDRILFGTDAVPHGVEYPQQIFCDQLYEIYYRFLETEDEYFDYAPAEKPPQGRWKIYGLGLPESILRKVYYENAARLFGLDLKLFRD